MYVEINSNVQGTFAEESYQGTSYLFQLNYHLKSH